MQIRPNSNVSLSPLKKEDASELFQLIDKNRNYLKRWLCWLDNIQSMDDVNDYIDLKISFMNNNEGACMTIRSGAQLTGIAHLVELDHFHKKASIGYWIGEEFCGQGLATNATRILINTGFEHFKLNRIEIRCATENFASQAIPKKLGLVKEGILRHNQIINGKPTDNIVYSCIKSEWSEATD